MKVPTILAILAAVALTSPIHAAPSASPSSASAKNGTLSNDVPDLLSRAAAEFTAQYNEALYSNSTLQRPSAFEKRAESNNVIPFCVGIASNPPRVRVFRNRMTCDISGWDTLYTFTAHTKEDEFIAPKATCSGSGSDPSRSMFFRRENCKDGNKWTHDFTFYESSAFNFRTTVWYADNPHRMLLYPNYNGLAHGWKDSYTVTYRNVYRLAADQEIRSLKADMTSHTNIHKKIKISTPNDAATMRCGEMLIGSSPSITSSPNGVLTFAGKDIYGFPGNAFDGNCTKLVNSSKIVVNRVTSNGFGSIEIIIGKSTLAAVSIKQRYSISNLLFMQALFESMRTGKPVMVGQNDMNSSGSVAFVQGTFIAISGPWNAPI
ncbi:hypothetical protein BGZ97_003239 [Linnemannia gamsii]|uniref:Uncharacterized protein n=1 Tax=Linnemannia gamsii TaxID=64522 RepID=A0A9P6QY96_9FUNG|nr:hypothetical protein BGZ97_003239 [Linnemannia gamsii]